MSRRESSEDYLEAILVIRRLRGSCRNVDIAERLGVSKAMATFSSQSLMEAVDRDVRLAQGGWKRIALGYLSRLL